MEDQSTQLFSVLAEVKNYDRTFILIQLTFGRLMDDIVIPYQSGKSFIIDGVQVNKDNLIRLKIIREKEYFLHEYEVFNYDLTRGKTEIREIYGRQYNIRLEALLRKAGEDVTSQIIKAYEKTIKPKLKSYKPNRDDILSVAFKFFWEGIKSLESA